jgi:16S rRNA processing protein RimM
MENDRLQIGLICHAHGLRGELKVHLHAADSDALQFASRVFLAPVNSSVGASAKSSEHKIQSVRPTGNGYSIIKLDGIADRTAAESVHGQAISVLRAELNPLQEDEVYLADLVGCAVITVEGLAVGRVHSCTHFGGNDMLVIRRPNREDALVPISKEIVVQADVVDKVVVIDPPEGLLDLDVMRPSNASN